MMGNYHVRFYQGGGSCVSWVPSYRREGRDEKNPLSNLILLREIHHWLSNYLVMPF
jgi:hypothetical protein